MLVCAPGTSFALACVLFLFSIGCDQLSYDDGARDASAVGDSRSQGDARDRDGPMLDGASLDGAPDASALGAFRAPRLVDSISTPDADESQPELSPDGLELYFVRASHDQTDYGIWRASRTGVTEPWDSPALVAELDHDGASTQEPTISEDGLAIWFASDRDGTWDVWTSRRTVPGGAWQSPTRVDALATPAMEMTGDVFAGDLVLLSTVGTSGGVFVSRRDERDAPFGSPSPMEELGDIGADHKAFVVGSGLAVYFPRAQTESRATDIVLATRESETAPFDPPMPVIELSSADDDTDPCLSSDLRHVVFASDRDGTWDVFEATR